MPIKWSAVKVNEAMDEVEKQVFLADQFISEAKVRAEEAKWSEPLRLDTIG